MHVCSDRVVLWMCNVSHTYCFNGPSALVLSAVVIRRMIVKMLFVFLLHVSEILSKLIVITNAANANTRAPRVFCVFEHLPCGT